MKKIIALILALMLLAGCSTNTNTSSYISQTPSENTEQTKSQEFKGVWISYYELDSLIDNADQAQFAASIDLAFGKISAMGLNTVIVHARANGDAYYNSILFPKAQSLSNADYDPLKIITESAKKHSLKVHAWVNPYRISGAKPLEQLPDNNIAKSILTDSDVQNDAAIVTLQSGVYFDPASSFAQQLIINGVREIVENYDVHGIHFDDYFYPVTDQSFDENSYSIYTASTQSPLTLADWRRENVNFLVKMVYKTVQDVNKAVEFGISPMYNTKTNYDDFYADVKLWLDSAEYVDYICPQLYFGYKHQTADFAKILSEWDSLKKADSVKLYAGLAPYKIGTDDELSENEWCTDTDILKRQVLDLRETENFSGFVFYSYTSLFDNANLNALQRDNLLGVIQKQ